VARVIDLHRGRHGASSLAHSAGLHAADGLPKAISLIEPLASASIRSTVCRRGATRSDVQLPQLWENAADFPPAGILCRMLHRDQTGALSSASSCLMKKSHVDRRRSLRFPRLAAISMYVAAVRAGRHINEAQVAGLLNRSTT
jgi:hypothetical protein